MEQKIDDLSVEELTSADFYKDLMKNEQYRDPFTSGEMKHGLLERAKALRIKTHVEKQLKIVDKQIREAELQEQADRKKDGRGAVTHFLADSNGKAYPDMFCGSWRADEDGVFSMESSRTEQRACYHPILPIRRMTNLETGKEQIVIAYKRPTGGVALWNELTVPKDMIANSRSITGLADYGISITSEGAKLLVRYLADVENYNDDLILLYQASSKLGWHDKRVFLPYDKGITFDAALKHPQIYNAIKEYGSYGIWLEHIKKIRASAYVEPRIALAASFSSILIKFLNISSVIVDFWGVTEAGKTVMLMVAASVWACPDEGQYIGDFMTTDAELEVRSDVLNNLPLILDDTAKMKPMMRNNIEQVIYNLASGSGKKRSNKELGSERVRTWKNAIIVNGERPLNSFVEQGGAINRIIEVPLLGERLFDSPPDTAEVVRNNYGFAGRLFVDAIKNVEIADMKKKHEKYCKLLTTNNSMQKQVLSMGALLLADELATEFIFRDEKNLSVHDVAVFLTDRKLISEGVRAYNYLTEIIYEKAQHFDPAKENIDQWGTYEFVAVYPDGTPVDARGAKKQDCPVERAKFINISVHQFGNLLTEGGFSRSAFTSWAAREGLLRANNKDVYQFRPKGPDGKCIKDASQERYISVRIVSDIDEYLAERHKFD